MTTNDPGRLLRKGLHRGYEWEVTRNFQGYRCGYVRIPYGHPWHGTCPDDAAVHGGLTFAEPDTHCGKGGADDAWWLGFDCAHACDLPDPDITDPDVLAYHQEIERLLPADTPFYEYAAVRTTEYVEANCRSLIDQALAVTERATP